MKEEDIAPLLPVRNDLNEDQIDTGLSNVHTDTATYHNGRVPPNNHVYNDLDHHGRDHRYEFSKTNTESSNTNQIQEGEEAMGSESVAIIVLVVILLVVILVFMWCFRDKIKDYTETYLDKITSDRIRKPSTVSLLKAYQLNKIKFPSYSGPKPEEARQRPPAPLPSLPPKDYSTRDLPPLPMSEVSDKIYPGHHIVTPSGQ